MPRKYCFISANPGSYCIAQTHTPETEVIDSCCYRFDNFTQTLPDTTPSQRGHKETYYREIENVLLLSAYQTQQQEDAKIISDRDPRPYLFPTTPVHLQHHSFTNAFPLSPVPPLIPPLSCFAFSPFTPTSLTPPSPSHLPRQVSPRTIPASNVSWRKYRWWRTAWGRSCQDPVSGCQPDSGRFSCTRSERLSLFSREIIKLLAYCVTPW